ncbi:hypothetical protein GCM10027167_14170 [Nocardia heshunensis]
MVRRVILAILPTVRSAGLNIAEMRRVRKDWTSGSAAELAVSPGTASITLSPGIGRFQADSRVARVLDSREARVFGAIAR